MKTGEIKGIAGGAWEQVFSPPLQTEYGETRWRVVVRLFLLRFNVCHSHKDYILWVRACQFCSATDVCYVVRKRTTVLRYTSGYQARYASVLCRQRKDYVALMEVKLVLLYGSCVLRHLLTSNTYDAKG